MPNRRRPRSSRPSDSIHGSFRLMHDVVVEEVRPDAIVISTGATLPQGENLVLEMPRDRGSRSLIPVEMTRSETQWTQRGWRHRVVLEPQQKGSPGSSPFEHLASSRHTGTGVLVSRLRVRTQELPGGGYHLESMELLPDGAVGLLEVVANGRRYSDAIRVASAERTTDAQWVWRAAAESLTETASATAVVRNVMAQFEIVDEVRSLPEHVTRGYWTGWMRPPMGRTLPDAGPLTGLAAMFGRLTGAKAPEPGT